MLKNSFSFLFLLLAYIDKVPKLENLHLTEEISFPMPAVERLNKRTQTQSQKISFSQNPQSSSFVGFYEILFELKDRNRRLQYDESSTRYNLRSICFQKKKKGLYIIWFSKKKKLYKISMSKLHLSIKGKFKQVPSTMYLLCLYVESRILYYCNTCNYDSIWVDMHAYDFPTMIKNQLAHQMSKLL